jgi:hypothetical protein
MGGELRQLGPLARCFVVLALVLVEWDDGVVPRLVTTRTVTMFPTSSPSDEAARPEGTVGALLRRPRVGAR